MEKRITRQRLDYLLKNWGCWQRSMSGVGPVAGGICGSAEGRYASDLERYIWEGNAHVPRETADDPVLAEKTEEIIVLLVAQHRRILVERFCYEHNIQLMAARLGVSNITAEARLDGALAAVWHELEEVSWASGL